MIRDFPDLPCNLPHHVGGAFALRDLAGRRGAFVINHICRKIGLPQAPKDHTPKRAKPLRPAPLGLAPGGAFHVPIQILRRRASQPKPRNAPPSSASDDGSGMGAGVATVVAENVKVPRPVSP